jgi:hypothetical protein
MSDNVIDPEFGIFFPRYFTYRQRLLIWIELLTRDFDNP